MRPADREQVSLALVNKGKALGRLGRAEEALAVLEDVVQRFEVDNGEGHPLAVATALAGKGGMLSNLTATRKRWQPGTRSRDASARARCRR